MFSSPEQFARAIRDMFETHAGFYQRSVQATMDASVNAMETNMESIRTLLATTTVATRQWQIAGGVQNWLTPVPQLAPQLVLPGWLQLAAPSPGAQSVASPDVGTAARPSLQ